MTDFNTWYAQYPRKTGIGAARSAWNNQLFFHAAKPEVMENAAKNFAAKCKEEKTEERFIPYPAKWLEAQCYLDADLQHVHKEPEPITGWRKAFEWELGPKVYKAYIEGADFVDGVLSVPKAFMVDMLKTNYGIQMQRLGVKEVKI